MKARWLVVPALLLLLAAACSREPAYLGGRMLSAQTPPGVIADWILQGRNDFLLFDLRPAGDFFAGHLPGAARTDAAELGKPGVVRALPAYKKLVFYAGEAPPKAELLEPLLERGLHVIVMEGGYPRWQQEVLTTAPEAATPEARKRDAVARYFRGESALGTPVPLKEIKAEQFLRPPQLPQAAPAPTFESEGC